MAEVRDAVDAARPKPFSVLLNAIVDPYLASRDGAKEDAIHALGPYAERLAYDSEFALAAHVRQVQIDAACAANFMWVLPPAYQHRASCLREIHDLPGAVETYRTGEALATAYGDEKAAIRIVIGRANLLRGCGRFEEARAELIPALQRAREIGDPELIGRASHESGIVMYRLGRYVEALVHYAAAFWAFTEPRDRHRLLNDIGRALDALGVLDGARHAWRAMYLAKGERYTRQAAAINLMALSHETRDRRGFDLYRAVSRVRMTPKFQLAYFFEVGDGSVAFGRRLEARDAYEHAAKLARRLGLDDEEKKARQAMITLRARPERKPAPEIDFPVVVNELLAAVAALTLTPDVEDGSRPVGSPARRMSLASKRSAPTR